MSKGVQEWIDLLNAVDGRQAEGETEGDKALLRDEGVHDTEAITPEESAGVREWLELLQSA
jgi:hypothetical protein